MTKDAIKFYWYILVPYTTGNLDMGSYRSIRSCKILDCGFCKMDNEIAIGVTIDKRFGTFNSFVKNIRDNSNYIDHYQNGDINSNEVIFILKLNNQQLYEKYKKGKYSELYNKERLTNILVNQIYQENALDGFKYNKFYLVMTKSEKYFQEHILIFLSKSARNNKDFVDSIKLNEFDSKPETVIKYDYEPSTSNIH